MIFRKYFVLYAEDNPSANTPRKFTGLKSKFSIYRFSASIIRTQFSTNILSNGVQFNFTYIFFLFRQNTKIKNTIRAKHHRIVCYFVRSYRYETVNENVGRKIV